MTHAKLPMLQDSKTKTFICQCGLDYFKAKIITGSIKRYLFLECPACGITITEDLAHG